MGLVTVREAVSGDGPGVARIHVETWRSAYRGIVPQAHLDGLSLEDRALRWEHFVRDHPGRLLLAERAGVLLGWVSFGPSRDDDAAGRFELYALYVDTSAQRQGVGSVLIGAAEEELWRLGAPALTLWVLQQNAPGRRFYEGAGYALDGKPKSFELGGATLTEVRYQKLRPLKPAA